MSFKKEWEKFTGKVEKTLDKAADDIEHALRQPRKTIRDAFTTDKDKEKYTQEAQQQVTHEQDALKQTLHAKERELTETQGKLARITSAKEYAEKSLAQVSDDKLELETQVNYLKSLEKSYYTAKQKAIQDKDKCENERFYLFQEINNLNQTRLTLQDKKAALEKKSQRLEENLGQIQTQFLSASTELAAIPV